MEAVRKSDSQTIEQAINLCYYNVLGSILGYEILRKVIFIKNNCQKGASCSQQPHYSIRTGLVLVLLIVIDPFLLTNSLELKPAKSEHSDDRYFRFTFSAMYISIFYYFSSTLNKKMIE
jgi:hypothetical protein